MSVTAAPPHAQPAANLLVVDRVDLRLRMAMAMPTAGQYLITI